MNEDIEFSVVNLICPHCKSANWMRFMKGKNVGELNVKCLNCFHYFDYAKLIQEHIDELTEKYQKEEEEKTMLKNFVIVKHLVDSGKYLFQVPHGVNLSVGDQVVCETKRSKDEPGMCCCDSFLADPEVVCPLFGVQPDKMKYVTGRIVYERFADEIAEDEYQERFGEE